jgi:hypothetical protein
MPLLKPRKESTTATAGWTQSRKNAKETQQVDIDMESEPLEPKLTQQQREACLRQEAKAAVNRRISEATELFKKNRNVTLQRKRNSTKRRVDEMDAAGISAQPSVEQKAPAIEATHDPRADSRVVSDPAAQLLDECSNDCSNDCSIISIPGDDDAKTTEEAAKTADHGGAHVVDSSAT